MKTIILTIGAFVLLVSRAFAAQNTLLVQSLSPVVMAGDTARVTVSVASSDQAINAVSGSLAIPGNLVVKDIVKDPSIVDFWTEAPHVVGTTVRFEGVVLNPGYIGAKGTLFTVVFTTKKPGSARVALSEGALLANDGLGTNIIDSLGAVAITITPPTVATEEQETVAVALGSPAPAGAPVILPVITEYSADVSTTSPAFLNGKGQPNALTKIIFKNTSVKSIGERFIDSIRNKRQSLDEVLVKNDAQGVFRYVSGSDLIAGVYNATPFLVDTATNTERPGLGVQLLVKDSKLVRILIVAINVLGLLVPIVGLIMLIYFIPWYSARRMHLLKRRLGLEEEKIELTEQKIKHRVESIESDH